MIKNPCPLRSILRKRGVRKFLYEQIKTIRRNNMDADGASGCLLPYKNGRC
jgi:hypothetical protein